MSVIQRRTSEVHKLCEGYFLNTTSLIRAYGKLSSDFATSSGAPQSCPLFLFNFVIDLLPETTFSPSEFTGIDLLPGRPLIDLQYSDDIGLFGEDADKTQNAF